MRGGKGELTRFKLVRGTVEQIHGGGGVMGSTILCRQRTAPDGVLNQFLSGLLIVTLPIYGLFTPSDWSSVGSGG